MKEKLLKIYGTLIFVLLVSIYIIIRAVHDSILKMCL